ncbi:GAF domain-containing sensor histidine kinase [Natronoflexus pectinivorans]|nr:ATP-binding protein [Natronoflexus pectinivorans]
MSNPENETHNSSPQSSQEINALIKISQSIISTLDYQEILQIISDGMAELLGIESAAIYLLQNGTDLYLGATTPALDKNMPDFLRRAKVDEHPHIVKPIQQKSPHVVEDTSLAQLSEAERAVIEIRNLKSLLYFPFVQKGDVLGVLILGTCNQTLKFSEHQISLGQTVANQLAVSIHNALLVDDLKKYKNHLEDLVQEKTNSLDTAIEELMAANEDLFEKNEIINNQNEELKTALQNLKDAQSQLIQSEKMASLGTLTAGVAHEINNPLNFLTGASLGLENYLEKEAHKDDEELKLLVESIQTGVERISNIVRGLNQFSRYNPDFNEECQISTILENCLIMMNNQIKDKITVEKDFSTGLKTMGNVGKIHQLFMNLLLNSVHAIDNEGKITIKTFPRGEKFAVIEIEDSGSGIDANIIHKITDPFFTTKAPGKGTGLGLSISYNIIKEHKGQLKFESEPGKGTKVQVLLPLR